MAAYIEQTELACAHAGCGVVFWITKSFEQHRRRDGKSFYCPAGHSQSYTNTTEQRLEEAKIREQRNLNRAVAAEGERDRLAKRLRTAEKKLRQAKPPVAAVK